MNRFPTKAMKPILTSVLQVVGVVRKRRSLYLVGQPVSTTFDDLPVERWYVRA